MKTAILLLSLFTSAVIAAPVDLFDQKASSITQLADGNYLIDFERVAFGNLRLENLSQQRDLVFHFGEAFEGGRINRTPPGTVRYATVKIPELSDTPFVVAPPADHRNTTHPKAVHTPKEWGVILPFRWVEIEGLSGPLQLDQVIRQAAFPTTWDDNAASFECSDPIINDIWELCRYSIKATSFAGVYVDGDRERIPYEADAYLNQLSGYYTDHDVQMARDTFDLLMKQPTWPSEWAPHMVFIARADWMHTGDRQWLEERYESLKTKTLVERAGDDGLIRSNAQQMKRDDIVDWPPSERDGFVFTEYNTVVNAFHIKAIQDMAFLALALNKVDDVLHFLEIERRASQKFKKRFFNEKTGLYTDGASTENSSLHANLFPLAFGLVPESKKPTIIEYIKTRGMACSVYAAQYLMEALFENGADTYAINLMTADNDRSWKHMVESGTTITWEAWDQKYKPNQDWNHAWGAAPANLLPRYILGAQTISPGWDKAEIRPHVANLKFARGRIPTPKGPIDVQWQIGDAFILEIDAPEQMDVKITIPHIDLPSKVLLNGNEVKFGMRD